MKFFAVLFTFGVVAFPGRASELPGSWPENWRQSYARFERFLEARARDWPVAHLTIPKHGPVETDFRMVESRERHVSVEFYQEGLNWGTCGVREGRTTEAFLRHPFNGGLQAVGVLVTTSVGYQRIPSLVWFTDDSEDSNPRALLGAEGRAFRVIEPPMPESDYWPSNRMLAWLDFQILPNNHPDDILERNLKVDPWVPLQVAMDGTIRREKLDRPEAEAALEWRIFYNGRLVEKGSAKDVFRFETARFGSGNFVVFVGVEGPSGFFPVSNQLRYTLVERDGGGELLFAPIDYGRTEEYPAWYRGILPPPVGSGPSRFPDQASFERARNLGLAWRGGSLRGNSPDAKWIYKDSVEESER